MYMYNIFWIWMIYLFLNFSDIIGARSYYRHCLKILCPLRFICLGIGKNCTNWPNIFPPHCLMLSTLMLWMWGGWLNLCMNLQVWCTKNLTLCVSWSCVIKQKIMNIYLYLCFRLDFFYLKLMICLNCFACWQQYWPLQCLNLLYSAFA